MIDLETSLENTDSEHSQALGINDRGTVVGVIGVPSVGSRGFVWRHGVLTTLGVLTEGGMFGGRANDINHRGVIVGSSGVGHDTYHASANATRLPTRSARPRTSIAPWSARTGWR
jgi:uncharacterized membrane protein